MKLLNTKKIEQLPCKNQWNNYITSGTGGWELSSNFIGSIEQAFSSDFQFHNLAIYNNQEELVFGCPIYVAENIKLDIILPYNSFKKYIYYWQKIDQRFLLAKVLFIGTPINDELDIVFKNQGIEKCIQLFIEEINKLQRKYNVRLVMFKNLINLELLHQLKSYGYFSVKSLPNSIIGCDFVSFEEFLKSLDTKKRRNINSKLRKAQSFGYDVQVKYGRDLDLDNIFPIFENNYFKSKYKFERLNIGLFRHLIEKLDRQIIWINILEKDYVVASSFCYLENNSLVMKRIGTDYSSSIPFLYFILHYKTIKYAIQNYFESIKLGPTAYLAKREMGAYLQDTFLLIKHRNLLTNQILKLFYKINSEYHFID